MTTQLKIRLFESHSPKDRFQLCTQPDWFFAFLCFHRVPKNLANLFLRAAAMTACPLLQFFFDVVVEFSHQKLGHKSANDITIALAHPLHLTAAEVVVRDYDVHLAAVDGLADHFAVR